jgi:hypothetical protein
VTLSTAAPPALVDTGDTGTVRPAQALARAVAADTDSTRTVVMTLPRPTTAASTVREKRAVPDVHGLTVRAAVYALHRAGFRVELAGLHLAGSTVPVAGSMLEPGSTVRLVTVP